MSQRTAGLTGAVCALVVGLALVAAYALGGAGERPAAAAPAPTDRAQPTLTTSGQGRVTGVPDQMEFTVSVSRTESDVAAALDGSSRTTKRVLHALASYGVHKRDVRTTGLTVHPSYDYSGGTRRLVGYTANQRSRVVVGDLRRGGKALSAAAHAGGNDVRLSGIAFTIADRDGLLARARRAAVQDAMERAREYAEAGHQRLGGMVSLQEVHTPAPEPVRVSRDAFAPAQAAAGLSVPVRAGEQHLAVRVKVVWALR